MGSLKVLIDSCLDSGLVQHYGVLHYGVLHPDSHSLGPRELAEQGGSEAQGASH